jgi:hypothetical protein
MLELQGVDVYVLGMDAPRRATDYWRELREFWLKYLTASGADKGCFSVLREWHASITTCGARLDN